MNGARRIRCSGVKFYGYDDVGIWDCPKSLRARRSGGNVPTQFPSARLENCGDTLFDSCPRYQASDKSLLSLAREVDRQFENDYTVSREAEKDGELDVVYPEGSTAQRRRNPSRVAPLVDRGWYPLLNYL